jgi:hypothetical protein
LDFHLKYKGHGRTSRWEGHWFTVVVFNKSRHAGTSLAGLHDRNFFKPAGKVLRLMGAGAKHLLNLPETQATRGEQESMVASARLYRRSLLYTTLRHRIDPLRRKLRGLDGRSAVQIDFHSGRDADRFADNLVLCARLRPTGVVLHNNFSSVFPALVGGGGLC